MLSYLCVRVEIDSRILVEKGVSVISAPAMNSIIWNGFYRCTVHTTVSHSNLRSPISAQTANLS